MIAGAGDGEVGGHGVPFVARAGGGAVLRSTASFLDLAGISPTTRRLLGRRASQNVVSWGDRDMPGALRYTTLAAMSSDAAAQVLVAEIDPDLADTAAMTEAYDWYGGVLSRALADWTFRHGAARVHLFADVRNAASQAVAVRAGFVREGVVRSCLAYQDGSRADAVLFGRLRGE